MRHILGLVTGYGLLTVTGNEHKQMRKAMNPAFSISNLTARMYLAWVELTQSDIHERLLCITRQLMGM